MKMPLIGCMLMASVLAGCTSPSLKETPFYTHEYEQFGKPDPDRINALVFSYRDPVLQVLTPLMEFGPKYVAIRPIYSVYDRDTDHPVYNVLWPLCRFDPGNQDYRIFPVYWGDEYFNVFPLYQHEDDPFAGDGRNMLFPLWIWDIDESGHSLDVFWPLYGTQDKGERHYQYAAWPFVHSYSNPVHEGHGAVPFYWYDRSDERSVLVSLPYSRSLAARPGDSSWDLALPLCYRRWEGEAFQWQVYPLLSWGDRDRDEISSYYALGLGHRMQSEDRSSHYVVPLYYRKITPEARSLYTLPWSAKTYADGMGWHTLLPVYYRGRYEDGSSFHTLPWWSRSYTDGTGWHALLPVYYRNRMNDGSSFYSLPWLYRRHTDGSGWHTSIPLYYYRSSADGASSLYSLPWQFEKHADGSQWQSLFPFYYRSVSDAGSLMLTPVYARKKQADGSTAWQCIIPVVYLDESYDEHFLTLLGGRWRMGDQVNWLALPLLSGGSMDADSGQNIWLAGMAGQWWTGDDKSHYIIPFYYTAPHKDTLISLPYTTWRDDDRKYRASPLLLSGGYVENDTSRSMLLAGLAGHRNGSGNDYHYVAPFYYSAPDRDMFISAGYTAWRLKGRRYRVFPPILSCWYDDGDVSGSYLGLGLAGYRTGDEKAFHYLLPFYYRAPHKDTFLSLPYAEWHDGENDYYTLPVFLTGWSRGTESSDAFLFGGLVSWNKESEQVQGSHVLPFYRWSRDEYLYTVLAGHNRSLSYYATPLVGRYRGAEGGSGSWALPFYYHRRRPSGDLYGYYFPLGYYRKNQHVAAHGFYGIYNRVHRKSFEQRDEGRQLVRERRMSNYLMGLAGDKNEVWRYASEGTAGEVESYRGSQSILGPLWTSTVNDQVSEGERTEESALLMLLYDRLHEQATGEEARNYLRRRVLWRLYHYEKLNGDVSVDMMIPGVTIDSYKSGYFKCSLLWRLFRYEKDPENGKTELDLLFIPLRR
ncbi:MAG TPA: hypothetical protein VIR77_01010 [Pontiella sp.]